MTNEELLAYFNDRKIAGDKFIYIDDIFHELDLEKASFLAEIYHTDTLIYLPEYEVKFFDWLKLHDYEIWEDLWGTDEIDPYVVGAGFLPMLLVKDRGYIICDLIKNDNFYFSEKNIITKNARFILEGLKEKLLNKEKLTVAQLLLVEMSLAPLDIWHFSYHYGIELELTKKAVLELLQDNLIEHWYKAEEVAALMANPEND